MKIFIAGAKTLIDLAPVVKKRLMNIYNNGYDILVGDCYGIDSSIQKFYSDLRYKNVIVFASNGIARNNIGNWEVHNVEVPAYFKGFDFYKQKDITMAAEADYGFMIWDGKSKGTLNNIINLISQEKEVLLFLAPYNKLMIIKNFDDLNIVIKHCIPATQILYSNLAGNKV